VSFLRSWEANWERSKADGSRAEGVEDFGGGGLAKRCCSCAARAVVESARRLLDCRSGAKDGLRCSSLRACWRSVRRHDVQIELPDMVFSMSSAVMFFPGRRWIRGKVALCSRSRMRCMHDLTRSR